MSWVPMNLAANCATHTNLTSCQPTAIMFLGLVAKLFGKPRYLYDYNSGDFGQNYQRTGRQWGWKYPISVKTDRLWNEDRAILNNRASIFPLITRYLHPYRNGFGIESRYKGRIDIGVEMPSMNFTRNCKFDPGTGEVRPADSGETTSTSNFPEGTAEIISSQNFGERIDSGEGTQIPFEERPFDTSTYGTWKRRNGLDDQEESAGNRRLYGQAEFPELSGFPVEEYDFIVVGAGSGGCVMANRLSEIPNWKVLLLEAGIDAPLATEVPAFARMLQGSNVDWQYRTQPDKHSCRSRRDGRCPWPRGKMMGGSSSINYLVYMRGNQRDYDGWAEQGNPGWGYRDVLPYFLKSENMLEEEILRRNPQYHSRGGYLNVEWSRYNDSNVDILMNAWNEIGYDTIDGNAAEQIGVMKVQMTSGHGKRSSADAAFIEPIRNKRGNLIIKTQAYVTRILIDPETKLAAGVEYVTSAGFVKVVRATKEVILSAGALNSPKILMLSGVGPKEELSRHGIQVIQDTPSVGRNLQDHVTMMGLAFAVDETSTGKDLNGQVKDTHYYLHSQRGPLSGTGALGCTAFVRTSRAPDRNAPNIQYHFDVHNKEDYLTDPAFFEELDATPLSYYNGIFVRTILLTPKSRGMILLNDSDPTWGPPIMYSGYFSDSSDLEAMVEGIEIVLQLLNTTAFREYGYKLIDEPLPPCERHGFGSSDYWKCVLMEYTSTIFHVSGSCKMGPPEDGEAVVDPRLRVYGIQGLRIVDASVMPTVVRANTNAPTIMIAEKASDMIKEEWLYAI